MNNKISSLNILGIEINFKPGADMDRIRAAAEIVEERYFSQKTKTNGLLAKDLILIYVALALADDLLQMKKMRDNMEFSLKDLLCTIEKYL